MLKFALTILGDTMKIIDKILHKIGEGIGYILYYIKRLIDWVIYKVYSTSSLVKAIVIIVVSVVIYKNRGDIKGFMASAIISIGLLLLAAALIWGRVTDSDANRTTSREFKSLADREYLKGNYLRAIRFDELAERGKQYERKRGKKK